MDALLDVPLDALPGALLDVHRDALPGALLDVRWDVRWVALGDAVKRSFMYHFNKTNRLELVGFIGLFFFILLSTYLPKHFPFVLPVSVFFWGISVAYHIFRCDFSLWGKILILFTTLSLILLGEKDYLCIVFAAIAFSQIVPKGKLSSIVFSLAPLLLIIDILGFWGLPFAVWLIYFWGFPIILVAAALVMGIHKLNVPIYISIFLGLLLIINQAALFSLGPSSIKVVRSEKDSGLEVASPQNLIKNLPGEASCVPVLTLINQKKADTQTNKWIIIAPATPELNDVFVKSNYYFGDYYIFGEHDNLGSFIKSGSVFNNDSFRRKGPWHSYRPIMRRSLYIASNQDPIYSNNIGCTLKHSSFAYPIIWNYSNYGIPLLLARGEFDFSRRLTCVGDSDSIVGFLVPYNPVFLQGLLNEPDINDVWKGGLLIICSLIILLFNKSATLKRTLKPELVLAIIVLGGFLTAYSPPSYLVQSKSMVNVSVIIHGPIFSPHYEWHYSSLPKFLSENGLTVAVNQANRQSNLSVSIIGVGKHELSRLINRGERKKVVIFMTPYTVLTDGETIIEVEDIPLAITSKVIYGKEITIADGRRLIINGDPTDCVYSCDDYVIIATNSPQLTKGLAYLVTTKNN